MRVSQFAALFTVCGYSVMFTNAIVLPREQATGLDTSPIATPVPAPPTGQIDQLCCYPGCGVCSIKVCNSPCNDFMIMDCCPRELLGDAKFFDDDMNQINATYADLVEGGLLKAGGDTV